MTAQQLRQFLRRLVKRHFRGYEVYFTDAKFRAFIDGVIKKVKDVFGTLGNWFKTKVIDPIAKFFEGLWNGIKKGVDKALGFFKKLNPKNWLKGKASVSVDTDDGGPGPGSGGDKPMADGGLLRGPTRILGGEYPGASGNPEVVSPLSDLRGMMVGDFVRAMKSFLPDLMAVQKMMRPQPAMVMDGPRIINFNSNINQSFNGGDRDMQVKGAKALEGSAQTTQEQLARQIRNQR